MIMEMFDFRKKYPSNKKLLNKISFQYLKRVTENNFSQRSKGRYLYKFIRTYRKID